MKFKAQRKLLTDLVKRFMTNGQMSLLSKKENLIRETSIVVADDSVTITGTDGSNIIFSQVSILCEVIEEGEAFISNIDIFYSLIKYFKGEDVTVETTPMEIIVSDGKQVMSDNLQAVPIPSELTQFKEMHGYRGGEPGQRHEKYGSFDFDKWFTIPDGKVFTDLEKLAMKEIRDDKWNISTRDNMIVLTCENNKMSKKYSYEYEGNIDISHNIDVEWIHPIFSQLEGETEFWIYISTKGNIQLWIHNAGIDWFVRYDVKS